MCPANPVAAHRQPRMQGTRHRQPTVGADDPGGPVAHASTTARVG